jgi:hypothetical protein
MAEIIELDQPFVRDELSKKQALQEFAAHRFKAEIIQSVDETEGAAGDAVSVTATTGSPTSAAARTCPRPGACRRSSCSVPRAPIGGATRRTPSCRGSTGPPGRAGPLSRSTSTGSRRPASATTASWAPSSTSSRSPRSWAAASRCGIRRAPWSG